MSCYSCVCECGDHYQVQANHLRDGKTKACRKCNGVRLRNSNSPHWKGWGEIPGFAWSKILREAENRSLSVEITIQDAWNLFVRQGGVCKLSGLPIAFRKSHASEAATASLDRIDSSKGYTLDNIQWVHKDINRMKNMFDQKWYFKVCKMVSDRNPTD